METAISLVSSGHKLAFVSPIQYEHSSGFVATLSKNAESEMELFTPGGVIARSDRGLIEWVYNLGTNEEGVEHIGVTWEVGELTDYDGVFDLPEQAITLLGQAGIRVGKDFKTEPDDETETTRSEK